MKVDGDFMNGVFDKNGKFNSKKMDVKYDKVKKEMSKTIMLQLPGIDEVEAEKLAEEGLKQIFVSAIKEHKVRTEIKLWFWWKNYKHHAFATMIGLTLSFALIIINSLF